jgi:hypothetical protein
MNFSPAEDRETAPQPAVIQALSSLIDEPDVNKTLGKKCR